MANARLPQTNSPKPTNHQPSNQPIKPPSQSINQYQPTNHSQRTNRLESDLSLSFSHGVGDKQATDLSHDVLEARRGQHKAAATQPTNKPTHHQPTNRPIKPPNHSINQPTNQSTNQSINQPINQSPTDQPQTVLSQT